MGQASAGNWGRWGAEDERGAANFITENRVRLAAGLVRRGRIFSLAIPIQDRDVPVLPRRAPCQHFMAIDGGDYAAGLQRKSGFQASDDFIALYTHGTTHIDALAHVWYDDQLYNGFPGNTVRSTGARRCGIDKLGHLVGRGVLLDLCRLEGLDVLPGGRVVGAADLRRAADAQGMAVLEGDIVLVRTGWVGRYGQMGADAFFDAEPGLGLDAARWLGDTGVAAIGFDNWGVEAVPTENGENAPVHRLLIRDYGMYLLELLALDELAQEGVHEFLFVAAPLRITGGVGSPLNPLAIA